MSLLGASLTMASQPKMRHRVFCVLGVVQLQEVRVDVFATSPCNFRGGTSTRFTEGPQFGLLVGQVPAFLGVPLGCTDLGLQLSLVLRNIPAQTNLIDGDRWGACVSGGSRKIRTAL